MGTHMELNINIIMILMIIKKKQSVVLKMWKPKNLLEALLPIYILHLIFCHGVIQYPAISKSKIRCSFVFSIITTFASFVCYIFVIWKYFDPILLVDVQVIFFALINVVTLSMYANIVISWFSNNVSRLIINNFKKVLIIYFLSNRLKNRIL